MKPSFTYGKQSVPVFKILRGRQDDAPRVDGGKDSILDMIVDILLEGDVSGSWLAGDNQGTILPRTRAREISLSSPLSSGGKKEYARFRIFFFWEVLQTSLSMTHFYVFTKRWFAVVIVRSM